MVRCEHYYNNNNYYYYFYYNHTTAVCVVVVAWLCTVWTANEKGAGTDANVQLVIYGKNDQGESVKSDDVKLDNKG